MANVVVGLSSIRHANFKAGVASDAELLARNRFHPSVRSRQFVLTAASRTFHDFRRTGVESQR